MKLDSKQVWIVGGLGTIGREISIACASVGAKITVLDNNESMGHIFKKQMEEDGYEINNKFFNCSQLDILEETFSNIIHDLGCPDIFINSSYPRTKDWSTHSFAEVTFDSFRENVDIHMNSHVWLARLIANSMVINKKHGSIIQFGSIYGLVGQDLSIYENTDMCENMSYAIIKGGIINLTRQMASYYGQFNIRVNTLCPGGILGPVAEKNEFQNATFIEQYSKKVPLKRLGLPEEIASVALFLASDASSYITGSTLVVDGGWTSI